MIGKTIGNYRIVTELGSGAMGQVYYAEHKTMGRRAAIKVIRPELSTDEGMLRRFLTEARSVNDIRHPNLVEITDFGRVDNSHYIMMELLEGETLEERIEREGHLSDAVAANIGAQVAAALGAAHEHGFIHRDLKPENIFLTNHPDYPDFVKVLDFGIAKLMSQKATATPAATHPGTVIGTPYYMSPEQCRGEVDLDHRSDIYALGVVLYHMVTGGLPFEGESMGQLLMAHQGREPDPPESRQPEVSSWMSSVILETMQKDREARPQSMVDVRRALLEQGVAGSVPAEPPVPEEEPATVAEPRRVADKLARIVLERLVSGKLTLPIMPKVAMECLDMLASDRTTFADLAKKLGTDPNLAPQVLRAANSAAYGTTRVKTLVQAISRLGARQLRLQLMELSTHVIFQSRNRKIRAAMKALWEHSLAVATTSREVAKAIELEEPDVAYLAGLLHDAGKPVVGSMLLEAEKLLTKDDQRWMSPDVWMNVVDECHREVGVTVARAWNMPPEITQSVQRSDRISEAEPTCIANVVAYANALTKREGFYPTKVDLEAVARVLAAGQQTLGLSDENAEAISKALTKRGASAGTTNPGATRR